MVILSWGYGVFGRKWLRQDSLHFFFDFHKNQMTLHFHYKEKFMTFSVCSLWIRHFN